MATAHVDYDQLTLDDMRKRIEAARRALAGIRDGLAGLKSYTAPERRHIGKLRDGEASALLAILDAVDTDPRPYAVLADRDGGNDPRTFESDLLRDRIARYQEMRAFAEEVRALADDLDDTVLFEGERVREPLLAAYRIARVTAEANDHVAARLRPAVDFYGAIGRLAAKTRRSKTDASPR